MPARPARRHPRTGELAYYRCYSPVPVPVPLAELVRVAGARWTVEETFQGGKGLTGLDAHQVRRWTPWRRWTRLGRGVAEGDHVDDVQAGPPPASEVGSSNEYVVASRVAAVPDDERGHRVSESLRSGSRPAPAFMDAATVPSRR